MSHFASLHQFLHQPGDVLDRYVRIDAVLIQEIDGVGLQTPQHRVDDGADVLRPAIEAPAALSRLWVDIPPELRRYHHLRANWCQRLTDQLLVREGSVGFGGIEEGDAALDRHADDRDRVCVRVGCPYEAESPMQP